MTAPESEQATSAKLVNFFAPVTLHGGNISAPGGEVHITHVEYRQVSDALHHSLGGLRRTSTFVAREAELEGIRTELHKGHDAAITQDVSVTGLGGVGKTQLALAYAEKYRELYEIIFVLRADSPTLIQSEFSRLAVALKLEPDGRSDVVVDRVYNSLALKRSWLLIFDNAEDPRDLIAFLPRTTSGHRIITSRHRSWQGVASEIPVGLFTPAESLEYLSRVTSSESSHLSILAEALGHFPLALAQAASHINVAKITAAAYIDKLRKVGPRLFSDDAADGVSSKPYDYEYTVMTTWRISLDRIGETSTAAQVLGAISFLSPDAIPRKLLEHADEAEWNEDTLDSAFGTLQLQSLIDCDPASVSAHRLVQAVVQTSMTMEDQRVALSIGFSAIWNTFPHSGSELRNAQHWPWLEALLPHAIVVCAHGKRLGLYPDYLIELGTLVALYLSARERFNAAREQLNVVRDYVRSSGWGGAKQEIELDRMDAVLLADAGFHARAEAMLTDCLGRLAAIGLRQSVATVETLSGRGTAKDRQGDPSGAESDHRAALEIVDTLPDVPVIVRLAVQENLAWDLIAQGRISEAAPLMEGALASERAIGDPIRVATALGHLSELRRTAGDFHAAIAHAQEAIELLTDWLPEGGHSDLSIAYSRLGDSLEAAGELTESVQAWKRALEIDRTIYDPSHPEIGIDLIKLADVDRKVRGAHLAVRDLDEGLQILERRGTVDQFLLQGMVFKVHSSIELLDWLAARRYIARALDIARVLDGPPSATLCETYYAFAYSYFSVGQIREAERKLQKGMTIAETLEGERGEGLRIYGSDLRRLIFQR